jgi:hypothetical protein
MRNPFPGPTERLPGTRLSNRRGDRMTRPAFGRLAPARGKDREMISQVLDDIPVTLDVDHLWARLHIAPGTDDAREFQELADHAQGIGKPKALFRECFVEGRGTDTVRLEHVTFVSSALRATLEHVERVFPYVATCGAEIEGFPLPAGDFVKQFWLDAVKQALLDCARTCLRTYLEGKYALGKTSTIGPGVGDARVWPLEQQTLLFSLLGDVKGLVGVTLTPSYLMTPTKTVSGILFPNETNFQSCQLCHRDNCPSRKAPFDPQLYETVFGPSGGSSS